MSVYKEQGFEDREEYLLFLSEDLGVDLKIVRAIAELYGESEDFDGLLYALDDYQECSEGWGAI